MTDDAGYVSRFSESRGGVRVCIVCRELNGIHAPTCPIVALDAQIRELTAHTGIFVSSIRDTLDAIGRILRDERRP